MKIYDIKNFIEVCNHNSFSEASRELYITRQSLLRSINNLENELGFPLFSRGPMGISLTDFGKVFYSKALEAMEKIDDLQDVAKEFSKSKDHRITIGIRGNFRSAYIVRNLIQQFSNSHEGMNVEIIGCESSDIIPSVSEGKMDFGFTIIPEKPNSDLLCLPLEKLEYCVLTRTDCSLAEKEVITPKDLVGEKIVSAAFSNHPALLLDRFAREENVKLNIIMDTIDMGLMYQLAHAGTARGILLKRDGMIAARLYDDLVCKPFSPEIAIHMGLVYNSKKVTEQKKQFLQYLKKNYNNVKKKEHIYD